MTFLNEYNKFFCSQLELGVERAGISSIRVELDRDDSMVRLLEVRPSCSFPLRLIRKLACHILGCSPAEYVATVALYMFTIRPVITSAFFISDMSRHDLDGHTNVKPDIRLPNGWYVSDCIHGYNTKLHMNGEPT